MRCPDQTPDEHGRLRALAEYELTGSRNLASLDPIVDLAVTLFDCPAAAVNLVGETSVHLAASHGIAECNLSRDASFCAHAINENGIMVVEDAALDPRFHDNPLVKAGIIRFYAGVALRAPSGHALGALCVIDSQPHSAFSDPDRDRLRQLAALVSDRLELRRMEIAARTGTRQFEARAMVSQSAIITCDENGIVLSCNKVAATLFQQTPDALCGRTFESLIAPHDRVQARECICNAAQGETLIVRPMVLAAVRDDGTLYHAQVHCSRWHEGSSARIGIILQEGPTEPSCHNDAEYMANYDLVTQLPNRSRLLAALDEAIAEGRAAGLIITELTGFSDINTTLGHGIGDRVLGQLAQRLVQIVPDARIVARIDGDEFAVMLDSRDPLTLARHCNDINAAFAQPLWIDDQEIHLGSCCGIAIAPDHAQSTDQLLGNAELALLQAQGTGQGGVALFMPHLRAQAVARRLAEAELHHAFDEGQFVLVYQPQVTLADGALIGAEALLRWQHPARGLLAPAEFLPLLEAGPLAAAVGNWVLDQACAQLAVWRRAQPEFVMSINLFAAQFRQGNLPVLVAASLRRHGLAPDAIGLEITENIFLDQQESFLGQMWELREAGVKLSFDDFGTGFASLNLLRDFPVSHIKIDKSFVQLASNSAKDRAIVMGLIRMGHELGLKVTAEGVETRPSAQWLAQQNCDWGQGYYFGEPCSAGQFTDRFLPANADVQKVNVVSRRSGSGRR